MRDTQIAPVAIELPIDAAWRVARGDFERMSQELERINTAPMSIEISDVEIQEALRAQQDSALALLCLPARDFAEHAAKLRALATSPAQELPVAQVGALAREATELLGALPAPPATMGRLPRSVVERAIAFLVDTLDQLDGDWDAEPDDFRELDGDDVDLAWIERIDQTKDGWRPKSNVFGQTEDDEEFAAGSAARSALI